MFLIGIITVVMLTLILPTLAGLDRWRGCRAFVYSDIEAHPNRIASTALWFTLTLLAEAVSVTLMVVAGKAMPRDESFLEVMGGVVVMLFSLFFTLGVYVFLTEHARTRKTVTL